MKKALFVTKFSIIILTDTKGPEIRTGVVDPSLGGKLKLVKGELIEVGTDYSKYCTKDYLACSYKSLPKSVKVGSRILVGTIINTQSLQPHS